MTRSDPIFFLTFLSKIFPCQISPWSKYSHPSPTISQVKGVGGGKNFFSHFHNKNHQNWNWKKNVQWGLSISCEWWIMLVKFKNYLISKTILIWLYHKNLANCTHPQRYVVDSMFDTAHTSVRLGDGKEIIIHV